MWRLVLVVVVVGTLVALKSGYVPAVGQAEGWAMAYARGLAVAHRQALAMATANPSYVGTLSLPAGALYANMSVQACQDATTVATWLPVGTYSPETPIARALHKLTGRDPGAGLVQAGRVLAEPGRLILLPCSIPDGTPVIATVYKG